MSYLETIFSLSGKVAVVTGAAGGLGEPIAVSLANAGAKVYLLDRDSENIKVIEEDLVNDDLEAEAFYVDLTKKGDIEGFVTYVKNKQEKIDILINAAGVTFPDDFFEYSDENWDKTYKVNLLAPYLLSKGLARYMNRGSIINITSINAELAFPNNPAYVTFKSALKGLTKSLALELGKYGIRVNNVGPGYMRTKMTRESWSNTEIFEERKKKTMLGRWGEAEDLLGAIVFLASDSSSYITGQDLYIDGGWTAKGL